MLMILSIISIFSLFIVTIPSHPEFMIGSIGIYFMLNKTWILFLFIPINIISIIFGLCYIRKGYKVKKMLYQDL